MSAHTHLQRLLLLATVLTLADVATATATHRPHVRKPTHGKQLVIGPTTVPVGGEVTECTYLKMPGKADMAVNRVEIKVQGGSHHVHLYRANDPTMTVADGHETCNMALDFSTWGLVLASQTPLLRWQLPPGVAFHFKAGEQLAAQTHYVDTGLLHTDGQGWATMNLYSMPAKKVTSWAGAFFGQDRDVVVPPHATSTATTRCVFPHPVKVLAATGHYHFRGQHFSASSWDGTTTGAEIYQNDGYVEPSFRHWGATDAPEIPGVEWTCTYDNPTDNTYTFGPFTDKNEHCNMFMFYYPAVGQQEFMTCVQKDQIVTVAVH